MSSDLRAFLRGLALLALIAGSFALIGQPTAAAVPVTNDLMQSYKAWLFMEHQMIAFEMAGQDMARSRDWEPYFNPNTPGFDWHLQSAQGGGRGPEGWIDAPQASTRAAVVLSAVGVSLETVTQGV